MNIDDNVGPYRVLGKIGEGGMGEVYRARDARLNRDVALKILSGAFVTDPDRLARFRREAQVLASLNHPNIAAIHGLEDSGATHALVLELVEGPTLADRIAEGPIALVDAIPIAKQIAEALDAAHQQGIIHRDLKPANIKIRGDGTVKVLDFGLAKAMDPAASGSSTNAANSPTSPNTSSTLLWGRRYSLRFVRAVTIEASSSIRTWRVGLHARAETAGQKAANLLVSIHHDSVQPRYMSKWTHKGQSISYSDRFQGHSLFVSEKNPQTRESLRLARTIGERMLALGRRPTLHHAESIPGENRELVDRRLGIYRFDDLILLKSATIPAVLVECGVIVNREEEQRLSTASYRRRLANAVADGIGEFCSARPATK